MATNKAKTTNETQKEAPKFDAEKLVTVMIPMIDGEDPYVNVGINGVYTQIRRGVPVEVKANVAEVLANSNAQMMSARENQARYEGAGKEFDWE